MTDVRLAVGGSKSRMVRSFQYEPRPSILISYAYYDTFAGVLPGFKIREWVLDSGAFTAANSGKEVTLGEYVEFCHTVRAGDLPPSEIFALDVIGDWRASLRNTERMWEAGIPVIPTFHIGEPWEALEQMAKDYPKIAIGGAVGVTAKRKLAWVEQCFAHTGVKAIHGLGMCSERMLLRVPLHSCDASSWDFAPNKYGTWKVFGKLSSQSKDMNLRAEVDWYMAMERRVKARWANMMTEINQSMREHPLWAEVEK